MPLLIPILITAAGAGAILVLVAGFLRGIRWGLRRRMHRRVAEQARLEAAEARGKGETA
jgi:hypothetical protein